MTEKKERPIVVNRKIIDNLPKGMQVELKRSFGKQLDEVSMKAVSAFVAATRSNDRDARETGGWYAPRGKHNLFFVTTMYCHYKDNAVLGVPFTEAVGRYYVICSDSASKSVEALMDSSYDYHGTFFSKLYSLIKRMESKGIYVDANDLYYTLRYWDYDASYRKQAIARHIIKSDTAKEEM